MNERFPLNLPRTSQNEEVYANCIRSYLAEIKTLKFQLDQETSRNDELKQTLLVQNQTKSDLSTRISSLESANRNLILQINDLQKQTLEFQQTTNELVKCEAMLKKYKLENCELKRHLDDLTQESNDSIESNKKLSQKNQELKSKCDELREACDKLESQVSRQNQKIVESQQNYDKITKKCDDKKEKMTQLKAAIANADDKVQELTHLNKQLKSRIDFLESEKEEDQISHSQEITNLSKSLFAKDEELKQVKKDLQKIDEQKSVIRELTDKLKQSQQRCQSLTDALKHSQEQLSSMQLSTYHEIEEIKKDVEQRENKHMKTIDKLTQKLRDTEGRLSFTENELEDAKQQLSDARSTFTETLSLRHNTHKQQLKYLGEKLEKSQGLCKELATQLGGSPTKTEYNAVLDRANIYQNRIADLEEKNELLMEENDNLRRKNSVLEAELRQLREKTYDYSSRVEKAEKKLDDLKLANKKYQVNEKRASDLLSQTLGLMEKKQKELQDTKRELKNLKTSTEYSLASSRLSNDDIRKENEEQIRSLRLENQELKAQIRDYQDQKSFFDELKSKLGSFSSDINLSD